MGQLTDWWNHLQARAYFSYFQLVNLTARFRVEGKEHWLAAKASGRPILWSFWHGQLHPFMHYGYKFLDRSSFVVITVGDERSGVLNRMASYLGTAGAYAVDMQGNPMASGRSVLRVIKAMKQGRQSAIAPDGPDGPADVPKQGISFLARKAAAAILPVGGWTRQAIELDRWDRYLVALPFARFHLVIGEPILTNEDTDSTTLLGRITAALTTVRARAQFLAGV